MCAAHVAPHAMHAPMHAVVMNGFGSSEVFETKKMAKPSPEPGQVLIHVKAAGFNPVDFKIRAGWYGGEPPKVIGFDCSGVVEGVGAGANAYAVGDEVYALSLNSSNGSYAEYTCVPVSLIAKKPANLSFPEAASVPLAAMTAYRATIANRAFAEGDKVFVAGIGGGVGSFAIQFLRMAGVKDIYTIAKNQESSEFLQKALGIPADHILIYDGVKAEDLKEQIKAMNGGELFDATLDLVGGDMKKLCLELTGHSGHFSTVLPEAKFDMPFWGENDLPRARNLSVHQVNIGSELGAQSKKSREIYIRHLGEISTMLSDGRLKAPVVEVVGGLSAKTVQKAHGLLESGRVKGKLVMVVE